MYLSVTQPWTAWMVCWPQEGFFMFAHSSVTKDALQITMRKVNICYTNTVYKSREAQKYTYFKVRECSSLVFRWEGWDLGFVLFFSLFLNIYLFRFASSVPQWRKKGCTFGGMLSDARNSISDQKWGLFSHIARHPGCRVMGRLANSVAQKHDLFALWSSAMPPRSHKMDAEAPDITSSQN